MGVTKLSGRLKSETIAEDVSGGGFRDVFRRLRIGSKISWFSSLRNRIPLDVSS